MCIARLAQDTLKYDDWAQGAHVIAVARAHHHALLRELGAVACLDYTTQDVKASAQAIAGRKLDAIADFVGGERIDYSHHMAIYLCKHNIKEHQGNQTAHLHPYHLYLPRRRGE